MMAPSALTDADLADLLGLLERATFVLDAVPAPGPDLVLLRDVVFQPQHVLSDYLDGVVAPHPEDRVTRRTVDDALATFAAALGVVAEGVPA